VQMAFQPDGTDTIIKQSSNQDINRRFMMPRSAR
jgi:hypothetical protein